MEKVEAEKQREELKKAILLLTQEEKLMLLALIEDMERRECVNLAHERLGLFNSSAPS